MDTKDGSTTSQDTLKELAELLRQASRPRPASLIKELQLEPTTAARFKAPAKVMPAFAAALEAELQAWGVAFAAATPRAALLKEEAGFRLFVGYGTAIVFQIHDQVVLAQVVADGASADPWRIEPFGLPPSDLGATITKLGTPGWKDVQLESTAAVVDWLMRAWLKP